MYKRCREYVNEDAQIVKRCRMSDMETTHSTVDEQSRVYTHCQVLLLIEEVELRYREISNQCMTRVKQTCKHPNMYGL